MSFAQLLPHWCYCLLLVYGVAFVDLAAEDDPQQVLVAGIQGNAQKFEFIELDAKHKTFSGATILGDAAITLKNGMVLDGFRFKAPENAASLDFYLVF